MDHTVGTKVLIRLSAPRSGDSTRGPAIGLLLLWYVTYAGPSTSKRARQVQKATKNNARYYLVPPGFTPRESSRVESRTNILRLQTQITASLGDDFWCNITVTVAAKPFVPGKKESQMVFAASIRLSLR
jgi:hypothetical protein